MSPTFLRSGDHAAFVTDRCKSARGRLTDRGRELIAPLKARWTEFAEATVAGLQRTSADGLLEVVGDLASSLAPSAVRRLDRCAGPTAGEDPTRRREGCLNPRWTWSADAGDPAASWAGLHREG